MNQNDYKYQVNEIDVPAILRNQKQTVSGKRARQNGEDAEKIFDSANKIWEITNRASFVGGHPKPRFTNQKVKLFNGQYTTMQKVTVSDKGSVDRIGNVKHLAVRVEIKSAEAKWRPKWSDESFRNEFDVLQTGAKAGCLSFVLAYEKQPPYYIKGQWYAIHIKHNQTLPDREEWIPFQIDDFPELVIRIYNETIKNRHLTS